MGLWGKIKIGWKWLTGKVKFADFSDLIVLPFNAWLAKENVARKVAKTVEYAEWVQGWLARLDAICPDKWKYDYKKLLSALAYLIDTLKDGQVSAAEINVAVQEFMDACDSWEED